MSDIQLVCIDDKDIPKEIPKSKWVKEGNEYTLIYVWWLPEQKVNGFDLAEIEFDDSCEPYHFYRGNRFAIKAEDLEAFLQLAKDCSDNNDLNITQLLEETELSLIEN